MPGNYSLEDITKSYKWLGHKSWTELNAFHPDYKPGREHYEWNLKKQSFPRIWYARNEKEVVNFVQRYSDSRTVCYSLNPRPRIFKNKRGYARSALDKEIEISKNILFDFDFQNKNPSDSQLSDLENFLNQADEYFLDHYLKLPIRAFTGRGYHLLFAYPGINVKKQLDIRKRLEQFRDTFNNSFSRELENLEVKLDKTQDLRRMLRIYGTAKPDVGIVSKFSGGKRVEDQAVRDYLLALNLPEPELRNFSVLKTGNELPQWFPDLIERDQRTRELWSGKGKPANTDRSRSGFDYSLAKRLLWLGHKNIDDLATVLALRPEGAVRRSGKGEQYIRRTIGHALLK